MTSIGITGAKSEAGYYFMPDFSVVKKQLAERGIHDSAGMAAALLQEADVAVSWW